jgi:hypothetical protein
MSRCTFARAAVPVLGVAVAVAAVIPAAAGPAKDAQSRATLRTIGGLEFKANRFVSDTQRFSRDVVTIDPRGRLTIQDRTRQDHTMSLVRRGQLPRNGRQMEACFGRGPCDEIAVDHGAVNPDTGEEQEPTTPLVNKGAEGFNRPGDSVLIPPRRKTTVRVTARRGSTLYYLCAIHPWMQGRLNVE